MKKKLLIFHPALAPYRIDTFNYLSKIFDLKVIFLYDNVWNHKFDQLKLQNQLIFEYCYLLKGPSYKGRVFRFGVLQSIRAFNPDTIISYEFSFTTLYIIYLKKIGLISQSIGTSIDDSLEICFNIQSKLRQLARKFCVNNLDYFIVLSEDIERYFIKHQSVDKSKIIISPILQDPDRLKMHPERLIEHAKNYKSKYRLENKKVLLFVGRFIEEKGLLNLIKILNPILKERPNTILVLVGDGDERTKLLQHIENQQLTDRIILVGRYEGDELAAWYLTASGFILPSFYEPFGAVINEALIFGIPICCSEYVGSSYLLNQTEDFLFNPHDIGESRIIINKFLDKLPINRNNGTTIPESRMAIGLEIINKNWTNCIYD